MQFKVKYFIWQIFQTIQQCLNTVLLKYQTLLKTVKELNNKLNHDDGSRHPQKI